MSNSYTVLARKYRPHTFSEVVGQKHVVEAMQNSIVNNKLHSVYLLSGTRGIGKTTIARIFTEAMNCENFAQTKEPCGKCNSCQNIIDGVSVDLLEIDAASKNRVEDTRELIETMQYPPLSSQYKVFIIDEVHMLSIGSFNALLKILEEPPVYGKFILCTTDPQKLPATVLSRCLHFQLKPFTEEQIKKQLEKILKLENIPYEDEALTALSRAANGSMRDCLSLTDQAIALTNQNLEANKVYQMIGLTDDSKTTELFKGLLLSDQSLVNSLLDEFTEDQVDWLSFTKQLLDIIYQASIYYFLNPNDYRQFGITNRILMEFLSTNQYNLNAFVEKTQLMHEIFTHALKIYPYSPNPKQTFFLACVRALNFTPDNNLILLNTRIREVPEETKVYRRTSMEILGSEEYKDHLTYQKILRDAKNRRPTIQATGNLDLEVDPSEALNKIHQNAQEAMRKGKEKAATETAANKSRINNQEGGAEASKEVPLDAFGQPINLGHSANQGLSSLQAQNTQPSQESNTHNNKINNEINDFANSGCQRVDENDLFRQRGDEQKSLDNPQGQATKKPESSVEVNNSLASIEETKVEVPKSEDNQIADNKRVDNKSQEENSSPAENKPFPIIAHLSSQTPSEQVAALEQALKAGQLDSSLAPSELNLNALNPSVLKEEKSNKENFSASTFLKDTKVNAIDDGEEQEGDFIINQGSEEENIDDSDEFTINKPLLNFEGFSNKKFTEQDVLSTYDGSADHFRNNLSKYFEEALTKSNDFIYSLIVNEAQRLNSEGLLRREFVKIKPSHLIKAALEEFTNDSDYKALLNFDLSDGAIRFLFHAGFKFDLEGKIFYMIDLHNVELALAKACVEEIDQKIAAKGFTVKPVNDDDNIILENLAQKARTILEKQYQEQVTSMINTFKDIISFATQ